MPKIIIDWKQLREEYLEQEKYESPSLWLKEVKGWKKTQAYSDNTKKNVIKWVEDKAALDSKKEEIKIRELEKAERQRVAYIMANEMNFMDAMIKTLQPRSYKKVVYITKKIKNADGSETSERTPQVIELELLPSVKDMSIVWEHLRTTLGKPTKVNQNNNIDEIGKEVIDYTERLSEIYKAVCKNGYSKNKTNK